MNTRPSSGISIAPTKREMQQRGLLFLSLLLFYSAVVVVVFIGCQKSSHYGITGIDDTYGPETN